MNKEVFYQVTSGEKTLPVYDVDAHNRIAAATTDLNSLSGEVTELSGKHEALATNVNAIDRDLDALSAEYKDHAANNVIHVSQPDRDRWDEVTKMVYSSAFENYKQVVTQEFENTSAWADEKYQTKLPDVVNDRYLHTNEETGDLEWSEVQSGSTYTAGAGIDITNDTISAKLGHGLEFDNLDGIAVDDVELKAGEGITIVKDEDGFTISSTGGEQSDWTETDETAKSYIQHKPEEYKNEPYQKGGGAAVDWSKISEEDATVAQRDNDLFITASGSMIIYVTDDGAGQFGFVRDEIMPGVPTETWFNAFTGEVVTPDFGDLDAFTVFDETAWPEVLKACSGGGGSSKTIAEMFDTKQNKLPSAQPNTYLHADSNGALEWSEATEYEAGQGIIISDINGYKEISADTSLLATNDSVTDKVTVETNNRIGADHTLQNNIDKKVDKLTNMSLGRRYAYVHEEGVGEFGMEIVGDSEHSGIAMKDNGTINVKDPVQGMHAANKQYVDTKLLAKQDKLPDVVNDRYLHTNAETGDLEWSEVQSGSTYSAGDGIDITNDTISAKLGHGLEFDNLDGIAVDDVELKAGEGITIVKDEDGFTISSTGGRAQWGEIEGIIEEQTDLIDLINTQNLPEHTSEDWNKFLHTNSGTGALEWAKVQQGIPGTVIATDKDGTTPLEGQKIVHLTQTEYNQLAASGQLDEDTYYNTDGDGPEAFVNWGDGIRGDITDQEDLQRIVPQVNVSEAPTDVLENVKVNETVYGLLGNRTVGVQDTSIRNATESNPYIAPSDGYVILTSTTGNKTYLSFGNSAMHYSMAEATGSERVVVFAVKGMSMYLSRTGTNSTFVPVVYYNP